MTDLMEREVQESLEDDLEIAHIVCHCTNANISACGLNMEDADIIEDDDRMMDCSLCRLVWPKDATTCPWGCSCTLKNNYFYCGRPKNAD